MRKRDGHEFPVLAVKLRQLVIIWELCKAAFRVHLYRHTLNQAGSRRVLINPLHESVTYLIPGIRRSLSFVLTEDFETFIYHCDSMSANMLEGLYTGDFAFRGDVWVRTVGNQ